MIISLLGRPLILTEDECVAASTSKPTPLKEARTRWVQRVHRAGGITTEKYVRNKLNGELTERQLESPA